MKSPFVTTTILGMMAAVVAVSAIQPNLGSFGSSEARAASVVRTPSQVAKGILAKQEQSDKRWISSEMTEQELETAFQAILQDQAPGVRMRAYLDRVIGIYFRAQSYLESFDRNLDELAGRGESEDLTKNSDYVKLQAARILVERERERIVYMYKRIWEVQLDDTSLGRDRNAALEMNSEIIKTLRDAKKDVKRVAVVDLAEELKDAFLSMHKKSNKRTKATSAALDSIQFKNKEEIKAFYSKENRAEISRLAELSKNDVETTQAIDEVAELVQADINAEARSPQTASIVPSPGSSGNVTGNTFSGWSITFDDGPHAKNTMQILRNLDAGGHKASFFWLAKLAPKMQSIVNAVKASGHDLANHSYSHAQLTKGSTNKALEITQATQILTKSYGQPVKLFRCPYGACGGNGSTVRTMIANLGMVHVFWNVDSLDWQDKNSSSVYARVRKQMAGKRGGVILFHDIQPQTIEASRLIMNDFSKQGVRLKSVQQHINEANN